MLVPAIFTNSKRLNNGADMDMRNGNGGLHYPMGFLKFAI